MALKHEVIVDTADHKLIYMSDETAEKATMQDILDLSPEWAYPLNFSLKRSNSAAIEPGGKLVSLFQRNQQAFLWTRVIPDVPSVATYIK